MATNADQTQQEKQPGFFARHQRAFYFLGFALFVTAVALSIYFTGGTTIPFIMTAGAKVGLNFGFLATMSPAAAVATSTAIVTGFTLASVAAIGLLAKMMKAIFKCCKPEPSIEPSDPASLVAEGETADHSSTVKVVKRMGSQVSLGSQHEADATLEREDSLDEPPASPKERRDAVVSYPVEELREITDQDVLEDGQGQQPTTPGVVWV